MKKIIFNLFALFAISISTIAQTVSVADVEALPGETVSFSVNLSNGVANKYESMTLYVYFPTSGGFSTTGDFDVSTSYWKNATSVVGEVDATTGLATIPFTSAYAISAAEVENLVTVYFTVASTLEPGSYTVTLKKTEFRWGSLGEKATAEDASFTVNVVERHNVTLDEESTTAPTAVSDVNVTVKRTINAGEWSTICLPFAMTADQMATAFGNDVKVKDFIGCTTYDSNDNITVNFESVTSMEANHPYIIKVSKEVSEFTLEGINIEPSDNPSVDKDRSRNYYNSFIGNYINGTCVPDYSLFLYNNKFYFSKGKTKIKGYRGYFTLDTAGADYESYSSSRIFIHLDDDETTSINSVNEDGNESVYDLQGRRVDNRQLSKGVYIVNGKKVLMK